MTLERRRPTLSMSITGATLQQVLTRAKERCDAYFDGAPYEFVRCDAAPMAVSGGGEVLLYEAEVDAVVALAPRQAPGTAHVGDTDAATPDDAPEDDEDEEVPIR